MSKIKLNDILNLTEEEISRTKFRFMIPSEGISFDPVETAKKKDERDKVNLTDLVWNGEKIYFHEGIIAIGFIPQGKDRWLMTGVVNILHDNGDRKAATAEYNKKYEKYNFRAIVGFHKKAMAGIYRATSLHALENGTEERFIDGLELLEIWNSEKTINDEFPGYGNVDLSWSELKRVLQLENWKTALQNQKGVYLITDVKENKRYVGSAYGKNMMLGRWNSYVETLHGGNKELKKLFEEEGGDYIKNNFRYSILESFRSTVDDKVIISREQFWKKILLTNTQDYPRFGYNAN